MLMAVLMVLCVNNCSNLYLCIKSQIPSLHVSPMCSHAMDINQVFSVVSAWRVLFHDAIGYDFCSYHIHLKSNGSLSWSTNGTANCKVYEIPLNFKVVPIFVHRSFLKKIYIYIISRKFSK